MRWVVIVAAAMDVLFLPNAQAIEVRNFSVTFFEAPPSSMVGRALKSDARACIASHVCDEAVALQEIGRTRFAIYESGAGAARRQMPASVTGVLLAPPDVRRLALLWESPASQIPAQALWVLTHVDAMPDHAAEVASMLKQLGEANTRETGHLRTIAGSQLDHSNHYTLIEVWASRADFEMHEATKPARDFRTKLAPMIGALYDSRLYQAIE